MKQLPQGATLATLPSPVLRSIAKDMLKFSTNLTAEVCGQMATKQLTGLTRDMRTSAIGMSRWCTRQAGILPIFVDHSGLAYQSRISAESMVALLARRKAFETLHPILKDVRIVSENREAVPNFNGLVRAKTGTLNFVNSLAGYIRTEKGRNLAFAFFAADLEAREIGKASANERPRGASTYANRARWLQQQLVQYWAKAGDA